MNRFDFLLKYYRGNYEFKSKMGEDGLIGIAVTGYNILNDSVHIRYSRNGYVTKFGNINREEYLDKYLGW